MLMENEKYEKVWQLYTNKYLKNNLDCYKKYKIDRIEKYSWDE
jgi:hypothetical protein